MTEQDMEIQGLRRRIKFLEEEILTTRRRDRELEQLHQLDMAEIVRLRRMIEQMEADRDL